jgi:hypothetical protein
VVADMNPVAGPPLRAGARVANKYSEMIRTAREHPGQWFEIPFPTMKDALAAQGSLRRRKVAGLRMTRQSNLLYLVYEQPAQTKLAQVAN